MKKIPITLLLTAILLMAMSCEKNDPVSGLTTLNVGVKHHTYGIPNATVWLKEGTDQFPGKDISAYDRSSIANEEGVATFLVGRGTTHYVFVRGYDAVITDSVLGFRPIGVFDSLIGNNNEITADVFVDHY